MDASRTSYLHLTFLLLAGLAFTSSATAQDPDAAVALEALGYLEATQEPSETRTFPAQTVRPWAHESSDLQADPRIHYGSLPTGLRYAWVNNPEPQERVYLRLHVDAGSFGETDTELGMAHFLEHMGFNGTDNFEAGTLIEWFQERGMSFGADTNAHTTFGETVYKLDMPSRDEASLRDGMQVLRDFAGAMTIADEEVQNEKGVIDGEQRERDSAGFRTFVKMLDRLYAGTLYATRMPIGEKEVRDAFTGDSVRAFYTRWYRPENMTLVIVGDLRDFDPTSMIEEYFGDFAGPGTPVEMEPALGSPDMDDLIFALYEPEMPSVQISVTKLKPFEDRPDTVAQRQADVAKAVAHQMLSLRFSEAIKKPETPYLSAGVSDAGGLEIFEGGDLSINADPEKWEEAMVAAYVELRLALNFGFQQPELDEIRARILRSLDEAVARESTAHSAGLREALLLEIESDVVVTTAAYDREILKPALEALTVEDCLKALRANWRGGQLSIIAMGNLELADAKASLMGAYEAAREVELEAGEVIEVKPFAYASDPALAGKVKSQVMVEALDFWQVEFENGVRLNIKQTDFKKQQILVNARVGEGNLGVAEKDLVAAAIAGFGVYTGGGLVEHDSDGLRRVLAGRQAGVGMSVEDDHFSFSGPTTPEDLLLQFELTCAFLDHPGYRDDTLNVIRAQVPLIFEQFKYTAAGPMLFDFAPQFLKGNKRVNLLGLSYFPTLEELQGVEMEHMREALAPGLELAPMEVTVVGDLDVNQVIAYAAQTFGALPSRRAPRDMSEQRGGVQVVPGLYVEREIDTLDQKATLVMIFPTTDGMEAVTRRNLSFLGMIVNDRLRLEVRERLGAAYSPGAQAEASQVFPGVGGLLIQANGDPGKVQELVEACRQVAQALASEGVTEEEVQRLSEPILKQLRDAQRTNGYWMTALDESQKRPASLDDMRTLLGFYENLSVNQLSALAGQYLKPEAASVLVVLPETIEEVIEAPMEEVVEEVVPAEASAADEAESSDG
ncbi:MAG: M16 family metallopeptidase [Planctomycetota bacterium]|jgi:zinc protease